MVLAAPHPLHDTQSHQIGKLRRRFGRQGNPIVSVDARKRELVGNFKSTGAKWDRTPTLVNVHDFRSQAKGIAVLYGTYDLQAWRQRDATATAAKSICQILADTGGSNSATRGAWKDQLQSFSDHSGLTLTVAHYPPGASKYNPVERRLFSKISGIWAGEPLKSYELILKFHPHHDHHLRLQSARLPRSQELPRRRKAIYREDQSALYHTRQDRAQMELHHHFIKCEVILAPMPCGPAKQNIRDGAGTGGVGPRLLPLLGLRTRMLPTGPFTGDPTHQSAARHIAQGGSP